MIIDSKRKITNTINKLKIKINNFHLYEMAFTHPSANKNEEFNYQKLEFIGDALLGSIISVLSFKLKPNFNEGQLTKLKIFLVNTDFLSSLSLKYNFQNCIVAKNDEAKKSKKVLADVFEAFIGAFYLDNNSYNKTEKMIKKIFEKQIINFNYEESIDFKTRVQEMLENKYNHIFYKLINSKMIKNNKTHFKMGLFCNDKLLSYGIATNKKEATKNAAKKAYKKLIEKYNSEY